MDGDEQVGIGFVGDIRTLLQGDEDIRGACIDDVDIGVLLLKQLAHLERKSQVEVLLL